LSAAATSCSSCISWLTAGSTAAVTSRCTELHTALQTRSKPNA
jgi:hypothetical protein